MIEYIGNRLVAWAAWCEQRASGALGYPPAAAFTRLHVSSGERFDASVVIDDEAWEIERAVAALTPELRAVAMAVYRVRGSEDQVLALLMMSRATLYRRLGALHQAVLDWLLDYHLERGDGKGAGRVRRAVQGREAGTGAGAAGEGQDQRRGVAAARGA